MIDTSEESIEELWQCMERCGAVSMEPITVREQINAILRLKKSNVIYRGEFPIQQCYRDFYDKVFLGKNADDSSKARTVG